MKKAKHPRVVLALSAAANCTLSACATPDTAARAPIPAEVARRLETVRAERDSFPRFEDIPAAPKNLRTPKQWASVVGALEDRGERVGSWPQRNPAWITDPRADAARLQALTRIAPEDLPRADQLQRTEAFVASVRARTVPPARLD